MRAGLADDQYGRNIAAATSEIAEANNAIFAINGDYYGFRNDGYVLRNGVTYRNTGDGQALIMDETGNMTIAEESELSQEAAWQIWSFGPALIVDGEIAVDTDTEISGRSANSNPRSAIGQIAPLHYVAIVSEGRTDNEAGLSLYQLAELFADKGCTLAYNLDGGGSSTMYFNGNVINNPTSGRKSSERDVSDIIYIGYE